MEIYGVSASIPWLIIINNIDINTQLIDADATPIMCLYRDSWYSLSSEKG